MAEAWVLRSLHIDHHVVFENVRMTAFTDTTYAMGSMSPVRRIILMKFFVGPAEWDFARSFFHPLLATKRFADWAIDLPSIPKPCCVSGYLSAFSQAFGPHGYEVDCEITVP
jgi:hypothetical protein